MIYQGFFLFKYYLKKTIRKSTSIIYNAIILLNLDIHKNEGWQTKILEHLSSRKELDDNLFENIANASQKEDSKEQLQALSKRFMIDDSVVLGTSTFYDFTREENKNKKVHVCSGTACMVARSQSDLHQNLETHFECK